MKRLSEDQIQEMVGRKERIRFMFMIAVFVAIVVNAFYFYCLYKFSGEKTFLLNGIEVFDIVFPLVLYVLAVGYVCNDVDDVSYFLWYIDAFISVDGAWDYGREPFMFVKQRRMYSNFEELKAEVNELKCYYSRFRYWTMFSLIFLLPVLLLTAVEFLFCGESARIYTIWVQNVAFYIFFIPKYLFIVLFLLSFVFYLYYKFKIRVLVRDSSKCCLMARDMLNLG